jgi:hypothetical protein
MKPSGYSGAPLAKKLGIKPGFKCHLINPPEHYFELFTDMPDAVSFLSDKKAKKNFIHLFTKSAKELEKNITSLRAEIEPDGMIWVSWPKKASKIETDITENEVRNLALTNGLVDVKVCAVDDVWSGLKLVIRVKDRIKV